ncbi:MAG: ABC transporter ATP-binding protein [Deferrisomatales bacterium]
MANPLLEVTDVSMDFGGIRALSRCSFQVREGQIFSLIGPNGAGKSTLFNVVSGVYRPTGGRVRFRGRRVDGRRASAVARMGMARSFQNIELFRGMTALENVLVGWHRHLGYGFLGAVIGARRVKEAEGRGRDRARELLEFLGIGDAADARVEDLPYGVQKKVEIARGLATGPVLLLLDEPAAGLNEAETAELMEVVRRIRGEMGITVFLVEHNMRFVMGLSDWVCALSFGQVLAQGTPDRIQEHPQVVEAYLGEAAC